MPEKKDLILDDSVKVNKKGEAILGRLYGPVAEFVAPTRNGRMYDESTWDAVFQKPLVKEAFENGGLLGELNHPEDRLETDLSKVAICMPEPPKKSKDGTLTASIDILDTPNGRIVYTLAKYGYNLGISSRADGEVYEAYDGQEHVDPDSFDLKAFDIVAIPSVKKARLKLQESLTQNNMKKALLEQLKRSSKDEQKIMQESLNSLNIDVSEDNSEKVEEQKDTAVNDGVEIVNQLQESLKSNRALEKQVSELQEKLSVCYAKEAKLEEELARYKHSVAKLSDGVKAAKAIKEKNDFLSEQLNQKEALISEKDKQITKLKLTSTTATKGAKELKESLSSKDDSINKLEEQLSEVRKKAEKEKQVLIENIEDLKKDNELTTKRFNEKVKKSKELVEHYQKVAKVAVDKYISSKAQIIGVTSQEIKNRLTENYSFKDIDKICEELQGYQLNLSKLPFSLSSGSKSKLKITESVEPIKPKSVVDDEVDESLLQLAGLNNK